MGSETINPDLQSAAADLADALSWLAEDAQIMRRIPVHDPSAHPELGPTLEVAALQAFYLPHRRLPIAGQDIWREIQGMTDLRFCDEPTGDHTPPDALVRFHKLVDSMLTWLVTTYDLMPEIPEKGRPKPKKIGTRDELDDDELRSKIYAIMVARVMTPGEKQYAPFTQTQLAEELGVSQPTVNRLVRRLFNGKGWAGYQKFVEDCKGQGGPPASTRRPDGRSAREEPPVGDGLE